MINEKRLTKYEIIIKKKRNENENEKCIHKSSRTIEHTQQETECKESRANKIIILLVSSSSYSYSFFFIVAVVSAVLLTRTLAICWFRFTATGCYFLQWLLRLHSSLCRIQVQTSVQNVLIDFLGRLKECFFYVLTSFSRCFQKQQAILVGELFRLFVAHVPLGLQVSLISDQIDHCVRMRERAGVCEPTAQVVVSGATRDVVDHESASRSSIVRTGHSSETLLASGVPNLQLYFLTRHFNDPGAEFDSNGVRTIGHELFLGELVQETRFADAHVADDDVFENVRVVVRTAR